MLNNTLHSHSTLHIISSIPSISSESFQGSLSTTLSSSLSTILLYNYPFYSFQSRLATKKWERKFYVLSYQLMKEVDLYFCIFWAISVFALNVVSFYWMNQYNEQNNWLWIYFSHQIDFSENFEKLPKFSWKSVTIKLFTSLRPPQLSQNCLISFLGS